MSDEQDEVRLTLRLPASLRDKLLGMATNSGRSLNAEMVHRLEKSIVDQDKVAELEEQIAELWNRVDVIEGRVEDHDRAIFPQRHDWK